MVCTFLIKTCWKFCISGCFSFYPTKHITGEGGMVISNNLDFRKIKQLKALESDRY